MAEPLVPLDQEYGQRQETVEGMRSAGLPLEPRGQGGPSTSPATLPAGRADFLTARTPSYPPDYQPSGPLTQWQNIVASTPNTFLRALIERMLTE